MADAADPLGSDRLRTMFAALGPYDHILLAVSGGADSTALLHLVAAWAHATSPAPCLSVATVDHGLRSEAAAEAAAVGAMAARLGLPHVTLTWAGPKPASGLAAAARAARYDLLLRHAQSLRRSSADRLAVVTAHTADDQAETVLMRLARGSGPDGLAGMRAARQLALGVALVRPLLDIRKSELIAYLRAHDLLWIEDPTNTDPVYERPRWRTAQPQLDQLGLSIDALTRAARRQRDLVDGLEAMVAAWPGALAALAPTPYGDIAIDRSWLGGVPDLVRRRVLTHAICRVGGQADPPPLAALETHLADLRPRRFTLHGADIDLASDPIRIRREAADPRNPPPIVTLDPGHSIVWDRRWRITLCDHAPSRVTVSALGLDGLARLTASGFERDPGVPAYTLGSLPALCTSARADMVAVPVLDWFAPPWQPMHVCAELVGFEIG